MKSLKIFTPYGQLPHDVIVRAWQDEAFRNKLLTNANEAFAEAGYIAPAQSTLVTINTHERASFVLPSMPDSLVGATFEDMLKHSIANTGDKASGTCDTT